MKACAIIISFNHFIGASQNDRPFAREFIYALKDRNPNLDILVVDNFSATPYPPIGGNVEVLRLNERLGYGPALNIGIKHMQARGAYDWYVCMNNDCWIDPNPKAPVEHGRIEDIIEQLDPRIVYGSGKNTDRKRDKVWQWSAWLCISSAVLESVGYFDEQLAAAFEDFDYEQRAMDAGYELDTAHFPIVHLDEHTRLEDPDYKWRWEKARLYFGEKHGFTTEPWLIVKGRRNA